MKGHWDVLLLELYSKCTGKVINIIKIVKPDLVSYVFIMYLTLFVQIY
jgi:hypothetical protein